MEKRKKEYKKTQKKPQHTMNIGASIIKNKEEIRVIVINMITASILTGEIMQHVANDLQKEGKEIDEKLLKLIESKTGAAQSL